MITKIKIVNYKSFSKSEILLNPFNVIIGANSVGKSNFLDALKFIQSVISSGLTYAIRKRYGWSGIKCRKTHKKYIEFHVSGNFGEDYARFRIKRGVEVVPKEYTYSFRFSEKEKFRYVVNNENVEVGYLRKRIKENIEDEVFSKFTRFEKEQEQRVMVEEPFLEERELRRERLIPKQAEEKMFLGARFMCLASIALSDYIEKWRFYKLEPEAIRNPMVGEEADFVSERGETLALILNQLEKGERLPTQNTKEKILSIMTTLVPGFEKWKTEELSDGRITFRIKEKRTAGVFTPTQIADGTLHLLGLLIALLYYREKPTLICIEEPERNIHPMILQELVNLMREVSQHVQIVVTTHSPYLIRFCKPEEVMLVDKIGGVTEMVRGSDIEMIDEFLEDFTMDELWLQKYLGRGTPL